MILKERLALVGPRARLAAVSKESAHDYSSAPIDVDLHYHGRFRLRFRTSGIVWAKRQTRGGHEPSRTIAFRATFGTIRACTANTGAFAKSFAESQYAAQRSGSKCDGTHTNAVARVYAESYGPAAADTTDTSCSCTTAAIHDFSTAALQQPESGWPIRHFGARFRSAVDWIRLKASARSRRIDDTAHGRHWPFD